MSDEGDPRGHGDGDIIAGNGEKRADALDFQFEAFLDSIASEGGHSLDDLIGGCDRAKAWLKECQRRGNMLRRGRR